MNTIFPVYSIRDTRRALEPMVPTESRKADDLAAVDPELLVDVPLFTSESDEVRVNPGHASRLQANEPRPCMDDLERHVRMLLRARINSHEPNIPLRHLGSMWVAAMCEESWESIGPWIKSSVPGFASKYASNADNDPGAKIT